MTLRKKPFEVLWETEKMVVTSISSFPTMPSTWFHFYQFEVCHLLVLSSRKILNLLYGKGSTVKLLSVAQGSFVDNVDQDHTAQNMQSDLGSILSSNVIFFSLKTTFK